mgnify:CR=1 FL=1
MTVEKPANEFGKIKEMMLVTGNEEGLEGGDAAVAEASRLNLPLLGEKR